MQNLGHLASKLREEKEVTDLLAQLWSVSIFKNIKIHVS